MELGEKVEVSETRPILEMTSFMKRKRTTSLKRELSTAQLTPGNEPAEMSTKMRRQPANTGELSDSIDP